MDGIPIDHHLAALMKESSRLGALQMAIELGAIRENVSRSDAIKRYGRARVDRWIREGLVRFSQDAHSSRIHIKRVDLEAMDSGEKLSRHIKP